MVGSTSGGTAGLCSILTGPVGSQRRMKGVAVSRCLLTARGATPSALCRRDQSAKYHKVCPEQHQKETDQTSGFLVTAKLSFSSRKDYCEEQLLYDKV